MIALILAGACMAYAFSIPAMRKRADEPISYTGKAKR